MAKKKKNNIKKTTAKKTIGKEKKIAVKKIKSVKKSSSKKVTKKVQKTTSKALSAKKTASTQKTQKTKVQKTVSKSVPTVLPKKTSTVKVDLKKWVTPLDDRLIVKITETEKRTAGGLYIPDTVNTQEGFLKAQVVAVGRGHRDAKGRIQAMDVQVGDEVLFAQYAGSKIHVLGHDYTILRESELLGVVNS